MQTIERPPEFSHDRCRFLGVAALSLAAMQLGPIGPAKAQGGPAKPARPAAIKPGALVQISRHEQTLPAAPRRLQAPSTAFQTAGAARP